MRAARAVARRASRPQRFGRGALLARKTQRAPRSDERGARRGAKRRLSHGNDITPSTPRQARRLERAGIEPAERRGSDAVSEPPNRPSVRRSRGTVRTTSGVASALKLLQRGARAVAARIVRRGMLQVRAEVRDRVGAASDRLKDDAAVE